MEQIKILKGYEYEQYICYMAKSAEIINYDSSNIIICFDYLRLAEKWGISTSILDMLVSCDMNYRQSMYKQIEETSSGRKRSFYIDSGVMISLLRKLKESGQKPSLNYAKEQMILTQIIDYMKERVINGNAKS